MLLLPPPSKRPLVREMVRRASEVTGIPQAEILGPMRHKQVCRPRFAIMLAARRRAYSSPQIARVLQRDHTVVLDGAARAEAFTLSQPSFAALVTEISR
jgi:chromosomal replication initiation ATPase DnaA